MLLALLLGVALSSPSSRMKQPGRYPRSRKTRETRPARYGTIKLDTHRGLVIQKDWTDSEEILKVHHRTGSMLQRTRRSASRAPDGFAEAERHADEVVLQTAAVLNLREIRAGSRSWSVRSWGRSR
ncbi:hypothetical protein B0H11DRAFT_2107057 [Mycena galericulata]|nr:hypothetical protein B0H11DRAFT_2107057 [Mycena galericulata]